MGLITDNWRLKAVAAFFAFVTWGVVVYAGNPPEEHSWPATIEQRGALPAGLVLLRPPAQVTLTVDGLKGKFQNLNALKQSIHPWIDLSTLQKGANRPNVNVENPNNDVTVRDVTPHQVDAEVDQLGSVTRKVQVFTSGQPDSAFVAGNPTASPETVTLDGPQTLVQSAIAAVHIDITGRKANVQQTATVQVESPDHKVLKGVAITPPQVAVTIPIDLTKLDRKVSLILGSYVGNPAAGFEVTGVELSPSLIEILQDGASNSVVTSISTTPVDLTGHNADFTLSLGTADLVVPTGVELKTRGPFIARVHISPLPRPSPTPPGPSPSP